MTGPHVFSAALWRWQGDAGWHFLTVPAAVSDEIEFAAESAGLTRGFGSVKVVATVGATTWATSLFPDKGSGAYVLPVKKAVRAATGVVDGDVMTVSLTLAEATKAEG